MCKVQEASEEQRTDQDEIKKQKAFGGLDGVAFEEFTSVWPDWISVRETLLKLVQGTAAYQEADQLNEANPV